MTGGGVKGRFREAERFVGAAAAAYRRGLKVEPNNAEARRRLAAITGAPP